MLGMKNTGVGYVSFLLPWQTPEKTTSRGSWILTMIWCKFGWFHCANHEGRQSITGLFHDEASMCEHSWLSHFTRPLLWSLLHGEMSFNTRVFGGTFQIQTINLIFKDLYPIFPTNNHKFKLSLGRPTCMLWHFPTGFFSYSCSFSEVCSCTHLTDFIDYLLCVRYHNMC